MGRQKITMTTSHPHHQMRADGGRDQTSSSPGESGSSPGSRLLGVRSLALISLAAVLSLRIFPSVAQDGWSSVAYYLLGALFFFLPLALVAAELGTGWPKAGGLYAWVKEAFGDRPGFLAVWFDSVENIFCFPGCADRARRLLAGCTFGLLIGFISPTGVNHWATPVYVAAMAAGIVICSLPPMIIEKIKQPSWIIPHPDQVLVDVD